MVNQATNIVVGDLVDCAVHLKLPHTHTHKWNKFINFNKMIRFINNIRVNRYTNVLQLDEIQYMYIIL